MTRLQVAELQIRGGTEDNSKIILLISRDPTSEPSHKNNSNDGPQHTLKRGNIANYPFLSFLPLLEH